MLGYALSHKNMLASFNFEQKLWRQGIKLVAGVDEVGRGPLAGPILAAAVIFPPQVKIRGLADSKKLSSQKRASLFLEIKAKAMAVGIGIVSHKEIDKINIWQANLRAMQMAVKNLSFMPEFLLLDGGRYKLPLSVPQRGITGGDRISASIAAASIVAKVTRDKMMLDYHEKYLCYRFDLHKGYGTKLHLEKLREYGACPIHRRSFAPVAIMHHRRDAQQCVSTSS